MTWSCFVKKKNLTRDEQIESCEEYSIKEMFEANGFR